MDRLNRHIREALRHLQALEERAAGQPLLREALEELAVALEELRVAADEMRAQAKELAAARDSLEVQHRRYLDLFESAPDGYVVTTAAGDIEEVNSAAATLLCREPANLIAQPLLHFVVADDRSPLAQRLASLLGGTIDRLHDLEMRVRCPDCSERLLSVTVTAVRTPQRGATGLRWLLRDLTEHQRAEAEMKDLQRLAHQHDRLADIGAIVAKLTHELGNPLGAVSMQAQLIVRRARRDPDQPLQTILQPAEQIVSAIGRLDFLIKDFMSFSREQRLEVKSIHLPHFVAGLVELWQPVAGERGIAITTDVPSNLPAIEADERKIQRVCDNLIKNAIESLDGGPGTVAIRAALLEGEKIRLSVEDTGSGIPEGVQLFRLFETTKAQGTGLGLAIAKEIVRAHGGDIRYERLAPRGTVFHIELPLKSSALHPDAGRGHRHGGKLP